MNAVYCSAGNNWRVEREPDASFEVSRAVLQQTRRVVVAIWPSNHHHHPPTFRDELLRRRAVRFGRHLRLRFGRLCPRSQGQCLCLPSSPPLLTRPIQTKAAAKGKGKAAPASKAKAPASKAAPKAAAKTKAAPKKKVLVEHDDNAEDSPMEVDSDRDEAGPSTTQAAASGKKKTATEMYQKVRLKTFAASLCD